MANKESQLTLELVPKNKIPLEADIQDDIKKKLMQIPHSRLIKIHGQKRDETGSQEPGIPDYFLCIWGIWISFETKRPGGKLTKSQEKMFAELEWAGYIVPIIYSWDDLNEIIEKIYSGEYFRELEATVKKFQWEAFLEA